MTHGTGLLLLAAAGGYWVLERADKHKGTLKRVGQVVGGAIIVVSLIGVVCTVWSIVTCGSGMYPAKSWMCPFSSKAPTPPATAP